MKAQIKCVKSAFALIVLPLTIDQSLLGAIAPFVWLLSPGGGGELCMARPRFPVPFFAFVFFFVFFFCFCFFFRGGFFGPPWQARS